VSTSGLTGVWHGTAGDGPGTLEVRINLLEDDYGDLSGVLFFGVPSAGPMSDVGAFDGSVNASIVELSSTGTHPVSLTAALAGNQLAGTLKFTDPAFETPVALSRFALPTGYQPVNPTRVYDSREDGWPIGPSDSYFVQVGGSAGIPTDDSVAAVLVNLTMTETDGPGYLTAWAAFTGAERPGTSNVNVTRAGATASNMAIVEVAQGGYIEVFSLPEAHVIVDVFGWFPAGSAFTPVAPTRLLDTRSGALPGPGYETAVQVAGANGVPSQGVAAVVLNFTATESAAAGYVTAWPSGQPRGTTSTINVSTAGQTIANHAIVPVGPDGAVRLFVSHGTHVIVDLFGWVAEPVAFPSEMSSEGMLRNGGFEVWGSVPEVGSFQTRDETPIGSWFVRNGSVDLVGPSQGIAHDGRQFVDLNGNSGYPGALQQVVQTNPARRYKVGFWLAGNPRPPAFKELEVSFGAARQRFSFDTTGRTNDDLGWTYHEFEADPDCSNATVLTFQSLTEGDAGPNLDAVTLTDIGPGGCRSSGFHAVSPTRILDTRPASQVGYSGGMPTGEPVAVQIAGLAGLPAAGVAAVVVNLTATETMGPNYVVAYPSGSDRPATSNVNLEFAGETRANGAVVPVGADGRIMLTTKVPVHLIVDVLGYFG
jgi:choice-of-anchor C domain-containing protein